MTRLRSKIATFIPQGLTPFAKRQIRVLDQLRGYPASSRRPGVVLMLHVGRCGSTVLANLRSQNPSIFWDGKLPRRASELYGDEVNTLDTGHWIRRQFTISGDRFYGFEYKILADQYSVMLGTTTPDFLEICKRIGVTHYILLTRRNTLRHVVSHYASKNRGAWHASNTDKIKETRFAIDIEGITTGSAPGRPLLDYLQEVEDAHDGVRRLLAEEKLLDIEYEADIDDKGAEHAYRKVCSFLGVEPSSVNLRNVKINPYSMSRTVENFDEITRTLDGTKFGWMIDG